MSMGSTAASGIRWRFLFLAGLTFGALALIFVFFGKKDPATEDAFKPVFQIPPQDPITDIPIRPVAGVGNLINPDELVLGVVIGKQARAYPLNMMNERPERKILNDTVGGRAIVASWCDYCHNGVVFSRKVAGKTLTFGVKGQLWKGSMIMYDLETWSHWSHILGECKMGKWLGKRLEPIPSVVTDWSSWKKRYPLGTVAVMERTQSRFRLSSLKRLEQFVLGINVNGKSKAWQLSELKEQSVINDSWNDTPVVAVFDRQTATARLFHRELDGNTLRFKMVKDLLSDKNTGTIWDLWTGEGLAGPLKGKFLKALPSFIAYHNIWRRFHPEAE